MGLHTCMPIFLDAHLAGELPRDEIQAFLRAARSATRDRFGVLALDLYCDGERRLFCVVAAPDQASVRAGHAAIGTVCRRVRRVGTDRSCADELGEEETAAVRRMIAADRGWPARRGEVAPGDAGEHSPSFKGESAAGTMAGMLRSGRAPSTGMG